MTFATLLNGYALNSTIRLTFSEPETCVGEALAKGAEPTRIVFATGSAQSQAISTGESTRTAHMNLMVCEAVAVAPPVNAWRVMTVEAAGISSGATSTGSFTRLAYVQPQQAAGTVEAKAFEPVRLARLITTHQIKDQTLNGFMLGESAWHDGRSDSFAESTIESQTLATRLIKPAPVRIEGTATLTPLAYDLTRWMKPRQARNRAISYVKEGLVFKLKVFQQYATGTAIARAHSRGTPNTILAFSITYAEAGMLLAQSAVKIARDAVPGRIVAQAQASGVTDQEHTANGQAVAMATATISPDITRFDDGVRYAYAQAQAAGIASLSTATAVRWPMVRGVRQPARAEFSVTQLIARDVYGTATAEGASLSDPVEAFVTHTVWMKGQTNASAQTRIDYTALRKVDGTGEATATTSGIPWHWIAVPADGVAQVKAEAWGANPRIYTDGAGTGEARASATDLAYKVAYVSGIADAGGATLGEAANVTRHMRPGRIEARAIAKPFYFIHIHASQPAQIEGLAGISMVARNARVAATPIKAQCGSQIVLVWAETLGAVGARHYRSVYALAEFAATSVVSLPWAEQAGEVGARHLRWIYVSRVEQAIAQGGASRNVFKINADDPAPDWRTLGVPYLDRSHLITASSREYTVQ